MIAAPPTAAQATERHERQQALRALLMNPLLLPDAAETVLVRRHQSWLREWLGRCPRWSLRVTPDYARLRKIAGDLRDPSRPAGDPGPSGERSPRRVRVPFTRRRYALLCLALCVLERSERQTTLGRLVDGLLEESAAIGALGGVGLEHRDERRDIVHCVRLLMELGVLRRVTGDEEAFVQDRAHDALYDVSHGRIAVLLAARMPPSLVSEETLDVCIQSLVSEPLPDTDEARNQAIRTRIFRILLDDTVLYYEDMSPAERAYFLTQRPHIVREIHEATGLVEESRLEGVAMVDPQDTLTDLGLPEEGTEGHITLLVAEWLARRGRSSRPAIVAHLGGLFAQKRSGWSREVYAPEAPGVFADRVLRRLMALGLVRMDGDQVFPRPALSRFRLAPEPELQSSLFRVES